MRATQPTLDQVREWPAAVNIEQAALALGVSRSALYDALREGNCPVQIIMVGRRRKVVTYSLIAALEGRTAARSA